MLQSQYISPRRRRHSLSCLREVPNSIQIMSVRRMRADLELYTGYSELRSREKYFAHLVSALTEIDKAYEACLAKLGPTIQRRANQVQALADRAKELSSRVEAFTSSSGQTGRNRGQSIGSDSIRADGKHHVIVGLAVGTERLSYAQTVLDEKVREVSDFQKTLLSKIGGSELVLKGSRDLKTGGSAVNSRDNSLTVDDAPGLIVKGLMGLEDSAAGKGTRKLLEVIGLWGNWLEYLKGRLRSYF